MIQALKLIYLIVIAVEFVMSLMDFVIISITPMQIYERNNMNMHIIDASYTFDRDKLIFRFLSDTRIDFRELARELASIYKVRIE